MIFIEIMVFCTFYLFLLFYFVLLTSIVLTFLTKICLIFQQFVVYFFHHFILFIFLFFLNFALQYFLRFLHTLLQHYINLHNLGNPLLLVDPSNQNSLRRFLKLCLIIIFSQMNKISFGILIRVLHIILLVFVFRFINIT